MSICRYVVEFSIFQYISIYFIDVAAGHNKAGCVFFAKIRGQRSRFIHLQVNNTGAAVDRSFIAGGGIEVHFADNRYLMVSLRTLKVVPVTNASYELTACDKLENAF